ncbi:acetyl-CoA synthetase-like protein [Russula aff. rugulosa BPL654]|nr:acetyl-CoA synthetase-like protein [Russula aff. rugulosa BPL654]
MGLSEYFATDDLTILLGLTTASIFLLYNLYKPQPLVHPILLGRQSDVARVRMPRESAVHRNYSTGLMGRFTIRPAREVLTLLDLIKPESDAPRSLWSSKISNSQLMERVKALGTGLCLAGLTRESNVLLLLNDSLEFLVTELALASHSITSLTLSSPSLLSPVLESHPPSAIIVHASLLMHTLELIYELNEFGNQFVIVVGELDENLARWADLEAQGKEAPLITSPAPGPDDVFTISFYQDTNEVQAARFTHQNVTSGVTAIRALLPPATPLSALDTIVSAHSLSTAFGRSVAYTALYEGSSFATLESAKLFQLDQGINYHLDGYSCLLVSHRCALSTHHLGLPPTTVLFLKPDHLHGVVDAIIANAKKSFLFTLAWRHKLAGIFEGFFTNESLWDRLVFDSARSAVFGDDAPSIRGVVVSDGNVPASLLTPARIALSVPLVITHTHPLVAAPILATHPQDVQTFPVTSNQAIAHVGPPTVNIEVKLIDVDDGSVEKGDDPEGVLNVRGPIVGRVLSLAGAPEADEESNTEEPWVSTGIRARVQTNGAFKAWTTAKV